MAGAPKYKVYTENVYRAAFKDAYDALMFLTCIGQGDIRCGHSKKNILFTKLECEAMDSYEEAAAELEEAERKLWQEEKENQNMGDIKISEDSKHKIENPNSLLYIKGNK